MIILFFLPIFLFTVAGCGDISPKTKGLFILGEKSFNYDRIWRVVGVGMACLRLAYIINFFNPFKGQKVTVYIS